MGVLLLLYFETSGPRLQSFYSLVQIKKNIYTKLLLWFSVVRDQENFSDIRNTIQKDNISFSPEKQKNTTKKPTLPPEVQFLAFYFKSQTEFFPNKLNLYTVSYLFFNVQAAVQLRTSFTRSSISHSLYKRVIRKFIH